MNHGEDGTGQKHCEYPAHAARHGQGQGTGATRNPAEERQSDDYCGAHQADPWRGASQEQSPDAYGKTRQEDGSR